MGDELTVRVAICSAVHALRTETEFSRKKSPVGHTFHLHVQYTRPYPKWAHILKEIGWRSSHNTIMSAIKTILSYWFYCLCAVIGSESYVEISGRKMNWPVPAVSTYNNACASSSFSTTQRADEINSILSKFLKIKWPIIQRCLEIIDTLY